VEASEPVEVVVTFESHDARRRALADGAGTAAGGVVPQGVTATTVADGEGVELVPMVTLRLPAGAVEAVAAAPGVESVAADATVEPTAQTVPWGTSRVSGPAAAATVGAANQSAVDVAVVDSGVDGDHPDLTVAWGTSTVGSATGGPSDDDWNDTGGHGTASAGVVAARDNDVGTLGVAPAVDLYAVKVYESSGTVTDLVEGIDAAVAGPDGDVGTDDDAEVLSLSLGTTDSPALERAVEEATAAGAVVVAAAGNDGDGDGATNEVVHPAKYPEVVAVSATDRDDEPARFGNGNFSSEGEEVDLAAPGALVETTRLGGGTRRYSGTSAATPHVAGAAALVVAADRSATPANVTRRLRATADDVDAPAEDPRTGTGRLNASRAVSNPFGGSVVDGTYAPRDPDRDGLYEDVDGDGTADLDDVFALAFDVVPDAGGFDAEERAALDFEPDGAVDLDDVFALAFDES
jgi:minor extracellular protease Epr